MKAMFLDVYDTPLRGNSILWFGNKHFKYNCLLSAVFMRIYVYFSLFVSIYASNYSEEIGNGNN